MPKQRVGPGSTGTSLPDQTGNAGKVLGTDGSAPEWVDSGGSSPVPVHKTGAYTAAVSDVVLADASGGDFTVTLPTPASGVVVTVKNIGASGVVTVAPHAAETIDGAATFAVGTPQLSRDFLSDGTDWWVI